MIIMETGSIVVGEVFIIANYAADHENFRLSAHPHHVTTALSLHNSPLLLQLFGPRSPGGRASRRYSRRRWNKTSGMQAPPNLARPHQFPSIYCQTIQTVSICQLNRRPRWHK